MSEPRTHRLRNYVLLGLVTGTGYSLLMAMAYLAGFLPSARSVAHTLSGIGLMGVMFGAVFATVMWAGSAFLALLSRTVGSRARS